MRLSSTYHPMQFLHKKSKSLIPGIDIVDVVYRDEQRNLNGLFNDNQIFFTKEQQVSLQNKRVNINQPRWFQKGEIYQYRQSNRQLKLEDEDLLTSLVLPFESHVDGFSDLLIIHFHDRIGIKSFDKAFKNLTTDEKDLISSILYNSLKNDFAAISDDKNAFEQIKLHYAKIQEENNLLKSKLQGTEEMYKQAMVHMTYSITSALEKEHNCKINLNDLAIRKIIVHHLNFGQVEDVIHNAFYIAFNLSMGRSEIDIHDSHIEIEKNNENIEQLSQYSGDKIIALLDRYETAAEKAFDNGFPINGKNVASHLTPSVSPPAITDALKKNSKKIGLLLEQFPTKWKLIRKNLRPLQIHQDKIEFRYKSSA